MPGAFVSLVKPPEGPSAAGWWFALRGGEVLIREVTAAAEVPRLLELEEVGLTPLRRQYLGQLAGCDCWSAEIDPGADPPGGMLFQPLRSLYGRLDERFFALAGRAAQIVEWDRTHQFCGRCGASTVDAAAERAKVCPACGLLSFPRLSPAVIVRVERGAEILLARSHGFSPGMYSVLAGFVEPGESLEEAVTREIAEEVGIQVTEIRYFGSQPWPFPHSLMIGFTATCAGGDLRFEDGEIEDAGWFTAANLPAIPGKLSIARKLIDAFVARQGGASVGDTRSWR